MKTFNRRNFDITLNLFNRDEFEHVLDIVDTRLVELESAIGDDPEDTLEELGAQLTKMDSRLDDLTDEFVSADDHEEANDKLESSVEELDGRLRELEESDFVTDDDLEKVSDSVTDVAQELQTLDMQVDALRKQLDAFQTMSFGSRLIWVLFGKR